MENLDQIGQSEYNEGIPIRPLLRTLWSYRRVIAVSVSTIFIVFLLASLGTYLVLPSEHQASLEFRVVFEGADKGQYPNGLAFSTSEIISTPVLTEVYSANDLKRYYTYDEFKNHIFILESNRDLELLNLEYTGKLADMRLTSVDRTRLEAEFRQRQEALKVAQYKINFQSPNGSRQIPEALMSKVLNDILRTWADQAANLKGILNYQVRIYTPNVLLKDFLETEDYFVRLDILRDKIVRIIANVDELLKLPGISVLKVGENKISLPEIRANLEDIRQFKVEPLAGMLWKAGVVQDPNQTIRYTEARLSQIKLDHQEAVGRMRTLQEALSAYMRERGAMVTSNARGDGAPNSQALTAPGSAAIPQLSESFLDRLVEISSQNGDVQYRQRLTDEIIKAGQIAVTIERDAAYYEELSALLRRSSSTGGSSTVEREAASAIGKKFDEIYFSVVQAVKQIDAVYQEESRHNLGPSTNLYAVTGPLSISTPRTFTLRTLGLYGLLTLMLSLFIVPLGCIVHHYFRKEVMPQQSPVPSHEPNAQQQPIEAKRDRSYANRVSV